ncbi:hypothetical protein QJS66_23435 (plasmid) [Kocuria rhizophila]|nr:hypothetical protein QJS66_23435 [Kocuria rhizophila]
MVTIRDATGPVRDPCLPPRHLRCTAIDEAHPRRSGTASTTSKPPDGPAAGSCARTSTTASPTIPPPPDDRRRRALPARRPRKRLKTYEGRDTNRDFIVTRQHRRFTELPAPSASDRPHHRHRHGEAGVGKTQSARRDAHRTPSNSTTLGTTQRGRPEALRRRHRSRTGVDTPEVLAKHRDHATSSSIAARLGAPTTSILLRDRKITTTDAPRTIDFTELIIIDGPTTHADLARATPRPPRPSPRRPHVHRMPGIHQRFRHYPQLHSRRVLPPLPGLAEG